MDDLEFENEYNSIIRALASVGRDSKDWHSLWKISEGIRKINPKYIDAIISNCNIIYQRASDQKIRIAISLGVNNPHERNKVLSAIDRIHKEEGDDAQKIIELANRTFSDNKIEFRLDEQKLEQYYINFPKIFNTNVVLKNIKLLSIKRFVDEISVFIKKYLSYNREALEQLAQKLATSVNEAEVNKFNIEKMYDILHSSLQSMGYPEIALKDKDPGVLANLAFNEKIAAEAVLFTKKQDNTPEWWQCYDGIPVVLYQQFGEALFLRSLYI